MKRAARLGFIAFIGLTMPIAACGGEQQPAGPTPTPPVEPAQADPVQGDPAPTADPARDPKVAEPAPRGEDPRPADPTPTGEAPAGDPGTPVTVVSGEPTPGRGFAYPGRNTIVRDPEPDTPAGVIMRALEAAMNPDANKGWEQFEALLHTSEKIPNALISRRELNFPAMRRKVHLFLIEDPKRPVYQWSYAEETGDGQLKVFVHNPKSLPTPCYLAQDPEQDHKWKIRTCSL